MKQMKKIQKYCINEKGGKIPSGAIEYHYDDIIFWYALT
jgi:hypothetical protein